jgi:hypothetical protein
VKEVRFMVVQFIGYVTHFGKYICNWKSKPTTAVSMKKAESNIMYNFKVNEMHVSKDAGGYELVGEFKVLEP